MKPRLPRYLLLLICSGFCSTLWAASCTIGASGVAFGSYDPTSNIALANNGSVTVNCTYTTFADLFGFSAIISLNQGSSGNYLNRTLVQGAETLSYNLYLDPGFSTIFGNGSAGTGTYTICYPDIFGGGCGGPTGQDGQNFPVPVYGRLPGGQDVSAGVYADTITATVTF